MDLLAELLIISIDALIAAGIMLGAGIILYLVLNALFDTRRY